MQWLFIATYQLWSFIVWSRVIFYKLISYTFYVAATVPICTLKSKLSYNLYNPRLYSCGSVTE